MPERASPEPERPSLHVLPGTPAIDLRILQANERTLLAWIRTGLAIMAFGFVVGRIGVLFPGGTSEPFAAVTGAGFVAFGTLANIVATIRYLRVRRAILEGDGVVPGNVAVLSLAVGLALLGAILTIYLLVP